MASNFKIQYLIKLFYIYFTPKTNTVPAHDSFESLKRYTFSILPSLRTCALIFGLLDIASEKKPLKPYEDISEFTIIFTECAGTLDTTTPSTFIFWFTEFRKPKSYI